MKRWQHARKRLTLAVALGLSLLLAACSSTPDRPKAAALPAVSGDLAVTRAWSLKLDEVSTPLQLAVQGAQVVLAANQGLVAAIDADSGKELWRVQLAERLIAGVGSDGRRHAVVSSDNQLIVLQDGRELWRHRLQAQVLTAPLVAGDRVFVQGGDRSVQAFDGASGRRLWLQQRHAESLVLRQAGVLVAVGDTLLAGHGGRLSAMQALTGQTQWDVTVGSSRGTNEVERLVDLVAGTHRQGRVLCVRAFQSAVGCVDTARGQLLWSRPAQGFQGLDGDEQHVFAVESDSKLRAWKLQDGQAAWAQDEYRFHRLSAPTVWGPALVVGDAQGHLHWLSRDKGQTLQRVATDGTAIELKPV
ncbi:MAG: outer membrane protein assembly factor BamB, partial [Betaproteobacteria bacterium]|nr:outer membrane protein assembly factor BamB [Betaproteobacteria bacterium]